MQCYGLDLDMKPLYACSGFTSYYHTSLRGDTHSSCVRLALLCSVFILGSFPTISAEMARTLGG